MIRFSRSTLALLALMALALALFYWSGTAAPALLGLTLFGGLALLRPDLALLFVPLTVPLYLIPAEIAGIRVQGFQLPLHEAALLATFAATVARWLWRLVRRDTPLLRGLNPGAALLSYTPHFLFVLAAGLGVELAVARGPALIEFRRVIAEPLLFYALVKYYSRADERRRAEDEGRRTRDEAPYFQLRSFSLGSPSDFKTRLLIALVLGGALAGLLGLLQYIGPDVVSFLGKKQCFAPDGGPCANIVVDGNVRRVLSVYGHPNNLGLALGRIWPIAAALALGPLLALRGTTRRLPTGSVKERDRARISWFFAVCALLCLGGIVVSFSRGAWLGALAAMAVLVLGFTTDQGQATSESAESAPPVARPAPLKWLLGLGAAVAVLAGLALSLRGDVTAGSTPIRLLLWSEALGYIRLHLLGIGLDQFGYYHNPQSGLSLIDPALVGTSEQYAAHPHNLLLDTWLRLGPLGLIAFGWLLVRFYRGGLRRIAHPAVLGALAAMTAALVHGMVDNFYFVSDLALIFWLLIALVETAPTRPS